MRISPQTMQIAGAALVLWRPVNALIGRLGDIDTICSIVGSPKWCSSSSIVGRFMTGEWWEPITILGGVALILWGERKRTAQTIAEVMALSSSNQGKLDEAVIQGKRFKEAADIFAKQERLARCADVHTLCENAMSQFNAAYRAGVLPNGYQQKAATIAQMNLQTLIVTMGYPPDELSKQMDEAEREARLDPVNCQVTEFEQNARWGPREKQNFFGKAARIKCMSDIARKLSQEQSVLTIDEALERLSPQGTAPEKLP